MLLSEVSDIIKLYTHLCTYPHLQALRFTYMHLPELLSPVYALSPSPACTYIHLHAPTFTCMHLHSLACTYIHLYAVTLIVRTYLHLYGLTFTCIHFCLHLYAPRGYQRAYAWRVIRPKFSAWDAWSVKVPKIGTWSAKPVMHVKRDLSYKMCGTRWVI